MANTNDTVIKLLSKIKESNINLYHAFGYERITVDNTVQTLTIPDGAKYALMSLESSIATTAARYLEYGGQVVTATTIGMPLSNGSVFDVTDAQNLAGFQITREAAGTHYLNVQYYK